MVIVQMAVSYLVSNDIEMIDLKRSTKDGKMHGCTVLNFPLLEELALISDIFVDKTGTLTKNEL